jgi:ribonuclease J
LIGRLFWGIIPAMKNENTLQVIPLGGLGEFGMNCMALRWQDSMILIDCGKMFPEDNYLGIESIVPDFTFLIENKDKVLGLFLTHGHEDHIGAVPYLRRELDIPIYGTPLTLGLTKMRLAEHGLAGNTRLHEVKRGGRIELGPFTVEFIGVSHGIPDSCALAIRTPAGIVIHTGDFKLDQTPLDGQTTDYHRLAAYGSEGVLLLLSDSTNVERPGYTFSEREVYEGFEKIFTIAMGKILVASFASHLHRMQQVIDLAEEFGRSVAFVGRSMEQNSRLAQDLGYLTVPPRLGISAKQVPQMKPNQVVVLASGSQAEPHSALTKIALDQHPHVKLAPGDVVALSARKIPGNERSIANIINHLYRRGAEVFHDGTLDIHVSGHACREELKLMLNLVKPRFFVPIHGEYRMILLHTELARTIITDSNNILLAQSGQVVSVNDDRIAVTGSVHVGQVMIDGGFADEIEEVTVSDRRHLATHGVIISIIVISRGAKQKVVANHFVTKGLAGEGEDPHLLAEAEELITEIIESSTAEETKDEELIRAKVGKALRRLLRKRLSIRPMILPVILEV